MELHQLRYAVAAGKYLNFTKAADSLHISQPSLSQQIAKLEQELSVQLFVRGPHGIALTDAGKDFMEYAEKLLNDLEQLEHNFNRSKAAEQQLSVGIVTTIADFGFRKMLSDFSDSQKGLNIKSSSNHGEGLLASLQSGELDACIIMCPDYAIDEQGLHYVKLLEAPLVAVLHKDHPLATKPDLHLEDLLDEPVFASPKRLRPDCVGNMRLLHDRFAALGKGEKKFLEYYHIEEVLQRVALNEGAVFMFQDSMLSRNHPKLVTREVTPALSMSLYLVCTPNCNHPAVDALFSFAAEYPFPQKQPS